MGDKIVTNCGSCGQPCGTLIIHINVGEINFN